MFMAVIQRFSVARLVMLMTAILMVSGQAQAVTSKKAKIKIAEEATSIVIDERAEVGLNPAVGVLAYPSRTLRVSLKSLGAAQPLVLRGVQGDASVDLSVRLDELVERAQLHLSLTLSPALIPYLSHVKVFLNDEVLHTIAVDKDKLGVPIPVDLALNPKYFKDFNKLRFQLIGHYILECEFPFHSSLWAEISNESYVDLQLRQLPLANDLSILPAPFFDSRDSTEQIVPFVYANQPNLSLIKASGSVASWLGKLAAYRGASFPVIFDKPPTRNAVVFATNSQRPAMLRDIPLVQKPTLSMISNPESPSKKLLLILGKDEAQVQLAADALVHERTALSGQTISIDAFEYPPLRKAYDAPKWMTTDRPVTLGELVQTPGELQVRGTRLNDVVNINTRMAPDLFTWNVPGVPVDLIYRYTPPTQTVNGALNILINDQFVKSYPLLASEGQIGNGGVVDSVLLPLFDDGTIQSKSNLKIPAFLIGGDNRLQFAFQIPPADLGRCKSVDLVELRGAIDPQSSIDLTGFDHYIGMPNLTAYANSGFPFTKFADLAQTTFVLPDQQRPEDVEMFLVALGRMGASTGYAGTKFEVITASAIENAKNSDLLVISSGNNSGLAKWGKDLPTLIEAARKTVRPLISGFESFMGMFTDSPYAVKASPEGRAILEGKGALAAISGLESPLHSGRSVVLLEATDGASLKLIGNVLNDPGKLRNVRGDLSVIHPDTVESFRINSMYYLGDIPWWKQIWFQIHNYPALLALVGILAGLMLTFMVFVALRAAAQRRLAKSHH
ncbi:MAG: cellulose biosynthesis cyclic di-GMP-binding regulatory protein BcsB [Rhodoferax sp.]|nr:cellulose biosynthesis cyclic di-GMP-binding regulatory protein BcsB [Rhodoferax sp.]